MAFPNAFSNITRNSSTQRFACDLFTSKKKADTSKNEAKSENGNEVDVITAHRSTGSILKPFLFASMLSDGEILPNTLVADIPTQISGYVPQNYNLTYDGAVPAKRALARSLNIPAVRMLQNYGIDKFNYNLKKLGMNTLKQSTRSLWLNHYSGWCRRELMEHCRDVR
jgi:penicillin-binding protein 1C